LLGKYVDTYCCKVSCFQPNALKAVALVLLMNVSMCCYGQGSDCWFITEKSFQINYRLCLTARQYGEVVLPDASTEQSPVSLATRLSRRAPREHSEQRGCKEGMLCPDEQSETGAQFLPSRYKVR
jgi:hypothetical protein